jgi:hypothetical protein
MTHVRMDVTWVDCTARDWAGLYVNGKLKWHGHPGDIEVSEWLYWMSVAVSASDFHGQVRSTDGYLVADLENVPLSEP